MKLFARKKLVVALSVAGLGFAVNAGATGQAEGESIDSKLTRLEWSIGGSVTATVPRPEKITPKDGIRNFFSEEAWEYLNITDADFPAAVWANKDNPMKATRLCEDTWGGEQMAGTKVTFFFGEIEESAVLSVIGADLEEGDPGYPGVVGVETDEWRFYQEKDTFRRTWHLEPIGDDETRKTITGIKIEVTDEDVAFYTLFDVYFGLGDTGTPNSELGRPFEPLSWPDVLDVPGSNPPRSVISATYSRPVSIDEPPEPEDGVFEFYNDMYAELYIDLTPGWDGNTPVTAAADDAFGRDVLPYANFIIDTDCGEGVEPEAVAVVDAKVKAKKGGISLNWKSGSVDGALAYVVWRVQAESLESADFSTLTNALVYDTKYVDTDVVAGESYLYSIVALENNADVARANDVSLVTETHAPIIGAVTAQ